MRAKLRFISRIPALATYLITFTTYGTRVHGDERSSVDRKNARFGTPALDHHAGREHVARMAMNGDQVVLTAPERSMIDTEVRYLAERRGWNLHALNVRTNHIHAVVSAEEKPEMVMLGMKSWATRRLTDEQKRARGDRIWTRHGSTRWLFDERALEAAIDYVVNRQ